MADYFVHWSDGHESTISSKKLNPACEPNPKVGDTVTAKWPGAGYCECKILTITVHPTATPALSPSRSPPAKQTRLESPPSSPSHLGTGLEEEIDDESILSSLNSPRRETSGMTIPADSTSPSSDASNMAQGYFNASTPTSDLKCILDELKGLRDDNKLLRGEVEKLMHKSQAQSVEITKMHEKLDKMTPCVTETQSILKKTNIRVKKIYDTIHVRLSPSDDDVISCEEGNIVVVPFSDNSPSEIMNTPLPLPHIQPATAGPVLTPGSVQIVSMSTSSNLPPGFSTPTVVRTTAQQCPASDTRRDGPQIRLLNAHIESDPEDATLMFVGGLMGKEGGVRMEIEQYRRFLSKYTNGKRCVLSMLELLLSANILANSNFLGMNEKMCIRDSMEYKCVVKQVQWDYEDFDLTNKKSLQDLGKAITSKCSSYKTV